MHLLDDAGGLLESRTDPEEKLEHEVATIRVDVKEEVATGRRRTPHRTFEGFERAQPDRCGPDVRGTPEARAERDRAP